MSWTPSQPNGWFPKLQHLPGDDVVRVAYGFPGVWVATLDTALNLVAEERRLSATGFVMGWIGPRTIAWAEEVGPSRSRLMTASAPDWAPVPRPDAEDAVAGNLGVADWAWNMPAGHWASYLAAPHHRTVIDGRIVAIRSGGVLSMAWPWVVHASTNDHLFIARYLDGVAQGIIPTDVPMNSLVVGRQGHTAHGRGPVAAHGPNGEQLGLQMVTPWRWEDPVKIVDIDGVPNLVTSSWDGQSSMVLIRPFGATRAQVVPILASSVDVVQVGRRLVIAGAGPRGELTVTAIAVDQPAIDLAPVVAPLPRGYVCHFFDGGRYGQHSPARHGTVIALEMFQADDPRRATKLVEQIVSAGGGFVTAGDLDVVAPIWDRIHGIWVHEPHTSTIDQECDAARQAVRRRGLPARPIIPVLAPDQVFGDDWRIPQHADWLAIECYEPESLDDWWTAQRRMGRRIQRTLDATGDKPVILIAQAYDRRGGDGSRPPAGFSEDALEAYQPVYFDAWRQFPTRVRGVWLFAYARPGGILGRPNVERWHRAAVAACPGMPDVEIPRAGEIPRQGGGVLKVTIDGSWPVQVEVEDGQKARVRVVAKVTSGQADSFTWRWRAVGTTPWRIAAVNPASDLDHHFEFSPGEYQIGLDALGPDGADGTGADRRIIVRKRQPAPPPPTDPPPAPEPGPVDIVRRFVTPNGRHFLTALNGGGHPGEVFRGEPAGLITAHVGAADVGGWQDFAVRPGKRRGTFGLRSVNGGWVSLQDDGTLIANVHKPADYVPDGRQAFAIQALKTGTHPGGAVDVAATGGGLFPLSIQGANGRFLAAINAGGGAVVMDRATALDWERWTPSKAFDIPALEPEPTRVDRPLSGIVRPFGRRGIADDNGPFLATTLSRFYLMNAWATDRDRVLRELDADARFGYNPRVLAEVGTLDGSGFWDAHGWNPNDPRTQQIIADITDAANERGIKVQWTAIGKGPHSRTQADRLAICRRVGEAIRGRAGVLFADAINEPPVGWSDGPGPMDLLELAEELDRASGNQFLIGSGAVWTEPGWDDEAPSMADATGFSVGGWRRTQYVDDDPGDRGIGLAHTDRDTSKSEEQDRPWRQSWDIGLKTGDRWCDNEGIGLGSSVRSETRPAVLRSHRLVAHICRAAVSCLHGAPGVRGIDRWEDQAAYHQVWKSRRYLDPDMVNGTPFNANSKYPGRPFELAGEFIRADNGNRRGIVRCYTVQAPSGVFYTVPFGPVDYTYPDRGVGAGRAVLVAQRRLTVKAVQQDLGAEVWERTVNEGDAIEIDSRYPDLLLISR